MPKHHHAQFISTIKILIGIWIGVLSLTGFAAYSYSFHKKKFQPSRLLLLYSVAFIGVFTIVFGQRIIDEYTANQFDLRNAGKLYGYLNIFAAIVSLLNALFMTNKAIRFFNHVQLFEIITQFYVDEAIIKSAVWAIMLKAVAFPVALEATLITRQIRNEPEKSIFLTIYTLLPWIFANFIPNCFFVGLVINRELVKVLNRKLQNVSKEVNCMQTTLQMELQKPFYRMQRFCDLADKLDTLATKYTTICDQTVEYMSLFAAPFLCSLVCHLFGITAGLFAHYHAIADSLINEESFDTFNALTNSVFLIISIAEITLQAYLSNESLNETKKTGHILQRMNLLHADIRFQQSVESFSLHTLVKKYKIQPWGLLEINVSLLHDVLSAVTSFLLILIQSDLALRFSLK